MKEDGKVPPEVRVASISNNGEVLLTFTHTMNLKNEHKDILNSRNITEGTQDTRLIAEKGSNLTTVNGHDLLFLKIISYETQNVTQNLIDWKVTEVKPRSMKIKLELREPLLISKGEEPDILLIQMNFGWLYDTDGQPLPDNVLKIEPLPPQIGSDFIADTID